MLILVFQLLMRFYTNESGDIKIRELLQDLSFFDTRDPRAVRNGSGSGARRGIARETDEFDDDLDEDLPERFRRPQTASHLSGSNRLKGEASHYGHRSSGESGEFERHPQNGGRQDRYGNPLRETNEDYSSSSLGVNGRSLLHTSSQYDRHQEQASHAALNVSTRVLVMVLFECLLCVVLQRSALADIHALVQDSLPSERSVDMQ